MEENKTREERTRTENYEKMTAKELFHRCLDKGIECPIKKSREYYLELLKGTKTKEEAKQDIIIEKLDNIQIQNGVVMSTIGNIIFVMLDRKDKLDLNVIHRASLDDCIATIAGALRKIEMDTGMYTEEEMKQSDKKAGDILDMILDLLK
nr:MAG TPA: hypothetical protein [Caudoviricetes sp.]